MLWSILIASHSSRTEKLFRLVEGLAGQLAPDVEVVVFWNRGGVLGELRQALSDDAHGEYVSFVDDDDRLPEYHVTEVLSALRLKPDYVGFNVEVTDIAGQIGKPGKRYVAEHSLRHARWYQKRDRFFRHVSHLNPIRKDLALLAPWEGQYSEDHRWADRVRPFVKTEVFIDRIMYLYDFDHRTSLRGTHKDLSGVRPVLPAGFRYHPQSEV